MRKYLFALLVLVAAGTTLLVAAFAGKDFTLEAYRHAVAEHYRFYSYGDCMFVM